MEQVGGHPIDPLDERWISPDDVGGFVWKDQINPNHAGHRYLAQRLTRALRDSGLGALPATDVRQPGADNTSSVTG